MTTSEISCMTALRDWGLCHTRQRGQEGELSEGEEGVDLRLGVFEHRQHIQHKIDGRQHTLTTTTVSIITSTHKTSLSRTDRAFSISLTLHIVIFLSFCTWLYGLDNIFYN